MTTELKNLQAVCEDATRAEVAIEELSGDKLSVSVHWPETQDDDGDHCHGQATIVGEARKVLAALEEEGWRHCEFGGRKDFGHAGGTTHFAVEPANTDMAEMCRVLRSHGATFDGGDERRRREIAEEWLDYDFSPWEADEWMVAGCWDTGTANELRVAGFRPGEDVLAYRPGFERDVDAMYALCNADTSLEKLAW
ncbi:MAG TPA: hypothetical protein VFW87_09535 [Pirellulales bacterium]|nr:hypothetical protein [Pirellulales bacterium]